MVSNCVIWGWPNHTHLLVVASPDHLGGNCVRGSNGLVDDLPGGEELGEAKIDHLELRIEVLGGKYEVLELRRASVARLQEWVRSVG